MKKNSTFLVTLTLTFFLAACGGDDGGGGGGKKAPAKVSNNPWGGIGAELPESGVDENQRALSFSDGMEISYDGSDEAGAEEVCRRDSVDEQVYEVCMDLEDDPYFVALENNAFVWHPLMFERFATELSCYSHDENGDRESRDCYFEVFPALGDDFLCEAGLVNGDKALKCSDDWAVVVNGSEDGSKSVCRVHLESGVGRCLGAPKAGVEDSDLILNLQRTAWDGYRSMQDNPRQFAPGDSAQALIPQDLPGGSKFTYISHDETICTVDNDDSDGGIGEVMILPPVLRRCQPAPEMCKVSLLWWKPPVLRIGCFLSSFPS